METAWAKNVLETWLAAATAARRLSTSSTIELRESGPTAEVVRLEDQTRRVFARVMGHDNLPELVHRLGRFIDVDSGIQIVRYAIGRLATDEETRLQLGSSAPKMTADALHPLVWSAAEALWTDGHHASAVQRAATFLNAEIQSRVNRHDVSDVALMNQTFSDGAPTPDNPRLRWPGLDDDLTVRAMRSGIRSFAVGCFLAIRNPITHSTDDLDRQVAFEQLAALSMLARWIERCVVENA
jgi:hypothetical protein